MEEKKRQVILSCSIIFILAVALLFTSCSESEHEGYIGVNKLQISLDGFKKRQEDEMQGFHTHKESIERSFYQSDKDTIMVEQIDNLHGGSRSYMSIDSLVQEAITQEKYAFSLGSARGRIIDCMGENHNHCYVSILDEAKGCAFVIECYSNDNNIAERVKEGFKSVYYYGNEYTCDIEDIRDKYPIAMSVKEARKHDGEEVTVKGEKYSFGWTAFGVGDNNVLLQIDGNCEKGGLGVLMKNDEDVRIIPEDCLGYLEGTMYVRGTISVYGSTALIGIHGDDRIVCDYETYIFHDYMMSESKEYKKAVDLYEKRGYKF